MDTMLRDLNSKLRGLDDIKDSLKQLDSLHHSKSSFKNIRTSPCSGEIKSKVSLSSSHSSNNNQFSSNSWKEILPTSPPTPNLAPKPGKQA